MGLRLLVIAPFPVLPPIAGGKLRIVRLARALADLGVEVTIAAPCHPRQRARLARAEPFALRSVPYPFALPLLLTDRPFPYGWLVSFHPGYRWLLGLDLARFDVCQLAHPAFVDLVCGLPPRTALVYDAQNVESDYVRSEAPGRATAALCGPRIERLERALLARADHVFACAERDRRRFVELVPGAAPRISLLPNGVLLEEPGPSGASPGAGGARGAQPLRRALFSGSAVAHNRAAAREIVERLAPAARDLEFVLHGPCGRRFRRRSGPNVSFDEGDDDLRRFARPGTVAIHPMTQGSGTSLKVLQYLACGLPVVSTDFGMRGLDDLRPLVTIAPLAGFPAALRRAQAPPDARAALAPYAWPRLARRALETYEELCTRKAQDEARPSRTATKR